MFDIFLSLVIFRAFILIKPLNIEYCFPLTKIHIYILLIYFYLLPCIPYIHYGHPLCHPIFTLANFIYYVFLSFTYYVAVIELKYVITNKEVSPECLSLTADIFLNFPMFYP